MMDKTRRLISVLQESATDSQAIKTADFHRNKLQIQEAIAAGWKLINIWKNLKDRNEFSGSYDSFRRYVKKLSSHISSEQSIKQKTFADNEKRLVTEMANNSKIGQRTLGLFLGKQDEIKEAIDAGYHLKTIWKILHEIGAFNASYNCFTCYVRKYITENSTTIYETDISRKSEDNLHIKNYDNSSDKSEKESDKTSGCFDHFNYSPTSIDKDSLI